jgi:hypothetical protein
VSSVKCHHCGLMNFASDEVCKRCKSHLLNSPLQQSPPQAETVSAQSQPPPQTNPNQKLCTTCGFVGMEFANMPGSFVAELALWILALASCAVELVLGLIMVLPAIAYTTWRANARRKPCPKCRASPMIPVTSPVAQKFLADHQINKPSDSTTMH